MMNRNITRFSTALAFTALLATGAYTVQAQPATPGPVPAAQPMPMTGFEDLAEKLLPTVVNVSTTTKIKQAPRPELPAMPELPPGSPFDQFFKEFYDQYRNAPPADEKTNALGSGFVVDAKNGYIVTNNHVIKDADEIKIILQDNTTLDATLVGTDDKTDLALLKVKPTEGMTAATWGDSDKARVGSWVVAIGNPFGLGGTVTAGIVSARQRDINAGPYDDFIQTDASINRGNSGGPMFNAAGEVIGVNTAIFSPSGGSVGIGFAVPSNMAKGVVQQLIQFGKTKRGWIGVKIQEVSPEIAESIGLEKAKGAMVSSVTPKSPAAAAGIEPGDVILTFDGHEISAMRGLPRIVADTPIDKKVPVAIWRKGQRKTIEIKLGQLETAEEQGQLDNGKKTDTKPGTTALDSTSIDAVGLTVTMLTDTQRDTNELPKTLKGVLVTEVAKDGNAAEKGLAPGDVIVEIDQQEVGSPKDAADKIAAAAKAGKPSALLFVARKGDMRFVAVKLKK
jgi:serine protease Do